MTGAAWMPAIERPFGAWRVHSLSDGGYFVFGCNGAVCSSARAANVQPISIVRVAGLHRNEAGRTVSDLGNVKIKGADTRSVKEIAATLRSRASRVRGGKDAVCCLFMLRGACCLCTYLLPFAGLRKVQGLVEGPANVGTAPCRCVGGLSGCRTWTQRAVPRSAPVSVRKLHGRLMHVCALLM